VLKSALFESLTTPTAKVLELHVDESVFFTFTWYSTVPPGVMAWADGVTTRIGVFLIHAVTLRVVMTLFDVLFAWLALAAVTEEVSVPLVRPTFALTVNVIGALVAPGARITEGEPRIDSVSKFVPGGTSLSFTVRLKVSFAQGAVSLFFTRRVYGALPPPDVIDCDAGARVTVGIFRTQAARLRVVVTVLEESA
jgi:hypothetical protein